jgi:Uma2 family endonuclease
VTKTPISKRLSFDEYLADDHGAGIHYELVNGELVEMPPKSDDNNIAKRLFAALLKYFLIHLITYKDTEIGVSRRRAICDRSR